MSATVTLSALHYYFALDWITATWCLWADAHLDSSCYINIVCWFRFDNVRIPRENLLNAVADVTPDGKYESAIKEPEQVGVVYRWVISIRSITVMHYGFSIILIQNCVVFRAEVWCLHGSSYIRAGDYRCKCNLPVEGGLSNSHPVCSRKACFRIESRWAWGPSPGLPESPTPAASSFGQIVRNNLLYPL